MSCPPAGSSSLRQGSMAISQTSKRRRDGSDRKQLSASLRVVDGAPVVRPGSEFRSSAILRKSVFISLKLPQIAGKNVYTLDHRGIGLPAVCTEMSGGRDPAKRLEFGCALTLRVRTMGPFRHRTATTARTAKTKDDHRRQELGANSCLTGDVRVRGVWSAKERSCFRARRPLSTRALLRRCT